MENTLVSIITPSYNSSKFIEETIKSVKNQTYKNWEMIIVDDCSTDSTEFIVKKYLDEDCRIKFYKNEINSGPALTRNRAITLSKGKFVCFLDSDDLWKSKKLENQLNFMISSGYKFTYTFYQQISENGDFIKNIDNLPLKVDYISSIMSNKIGCLTVMYDQQFFGKILMENIPRRQDYTLWLKFLKKTEYAYCLNEVLSCYRLRSGSISSNKLKLIFDHWNIYKNIERHSFSKSLYYLINYIWVKIFK